MPFISSSELDQLREYKRKYMYGNEELKEKLKDTNKELKLISVSYSALMTVHKRDTKLMENEINSLKIELEKSKEQCTSMTHTIDGLEKGMRKLENEIKKYHPKLVPKPRKVTPNDVTKVKDLINSNPYRVVSKMTDLSIKTISRISKGDYDKLLQE